MEIKDLTVNVGVIASFFGVSERRVQQFVEQGMPRDARGEYNLYECCQWKYADYERQLETLKNSGDEAHLELKKDGQRISNMERKVKLDAILAKLVEREAVRFEWTSEVKNFKRALKTLIPKLLARLEGVTDLEEIRKIITEEIDFILESLATELKFEETNEDRTTFLNEISDDAN